MRISTLLIPTLRDPPSDAEVTSHQLMVRAGMIRQLAAGIYTWLPLGLRVLRKVEKIIRGEMESIGAQEVLMSSVQPAELWKESGRWEAYGAELLRFMDRHSREFCLGPTHEEIITDLIRGEIRSYKQLPAIFYQIQTKFRDEIRPRFGVMRAREFLMKDAYSFHISDASLEKTYWDMHAAYCAIFEQIGLTYRAVVADTGAIGGSQSHEFHVLANSGEDEIAFSTVSDYASNLELVPNAPPTETRPEPGSELQKVETPSQQTIDDIAIFFGVPQTSCMKTLVVEAADDGLVALILRGDHQLNVIKAQRHPAIADPLRFANADRIKKAIGCTPGSIGPLGLPFPVIADADTVTMSDFICGANEEGMHLTGVNWGRDLEEPVYADLRNACWGERSPDGEGILEIRRGIEVGHIFQLKTKYSDAMKATVLDQDGSAVAMSMGCYGIGVSRIVAAAVEQNHDEKGIVWPAAIAPFDCAIVPINMHKSERLRKAADKLYNKLKKAGLDVLLHDGRERPGVMFNDLELIGIPNRLVISDKGLDEGTLEYKSRSGEKVETIKSSNAVTFLRGKLPT